MKPSKHDWPAADGWLVVDMILIVAVLWLTFNGPQFIGGWGWFLLLGLSPSAYR